MMTKTTRPSILRFGLIVGIFSLAAALSYQLYMNFYERLTTRLTADVSVIDDVYGCMYLIRCDSGYIAIDAGLNSSIVQKGLAYNNIKPEEVRWLFVTHTDPDHINGIDLFKRAKIYISSREIEMIRNKVSRYSYLPFVKNSFDVNGYRTVDDGDVIDAGARHILCVSLPGHTMGSMGYVIDSVYFFSGDAFRLKNGVVEEPSFKLFTMDIDQLRLSIRKAARLSGIKYVFTGHTGFTADPARSFQKWR